MALRLRVSRYNFSYNLRVSSPGRSDDGRKRRESSFLLCPAVQRAPGALLEGYLSYGPLINFATAMNFASSTP